ncbi:MAG: pilus assembly protein PilP [Desulfobacteraceae bacterium]|nr:pilus assembly protein PilP [Desulfobacteraceae bacterium]
MGNRTFFIALTLFFLLPWCLGLGKAPEKQEQDIHVSKEVKIDQQQDADKQARPEQKQQDKGASKARAEGGSAGKEAEVSKKKGQDGGLDQQALVEEAAPAEKELGELMLTEQEALLGDEERYYTRKGRMDPFEPFIHKEESENGQEEGEKKLERRKPQTPLEKIALSQLKLTAILRIPGENKSIAMVEDQTGKGYVVKQGAYIGEKGGQVVDILNDRIIIEEKYKDVYGKIAVREIEKKLQN